MSVRLHTGEPAWKVGISENPERRAKEIEQDRAYNSVKTELKCALPSESDARSAEKRCKHVLQKLGYRKESDVQTHSSGETELFNRAPGSLSIKDLVQRCTKVQRDFADKGWSGANMQGKSRGEQGNLFERPE